MEKDLDFLVNQFWNHVHLGQWELACGVSYSIREISWKYYENILVAVVLDPDKYSTGSRTLATPFHLSWLAAKELEKYAHISELRLPPQILKELEFKILLHHIETTASDVVLQELSFYHTQLLNHEFALLQLDHIEMFSSETCDFIGELITEYPLFALTLTNILVGKSDIYKFNNFNLCQLYVNRISTRMESMSSIEYFSDNLDRFLHMLSVTKKHFSSHDTALVNHFENLARTILRVDEKSILSLYSSLIDLENTGLITAVINAEQRFTVDAYTFVDKAPEHTIRLAEVISQHLTSGQQEDWKKLFVLCFCKKVHILQCVMNGCLFLIEQRKYEKAASILSSQLLKPLAPLVLLLSWIKCSDFNEATLLLKFLLDDKDDLPGFLGPVCKKLVYQMKLIKWCMEKTKAILGPDHDTSMLLDVLFKQLDSSSVLYVLNKTKLLKSMKNEEVVDILEQQMVFEDVVENKIHSNNEVEVFSCFAILKRFINLMLGSINGVLIEHDGVKVPFTADLVKTYIAEIKTDLMKVEPINLRIEILENIFSLLFLRTSDIKTHIREDIDHDNVEDKSMNSSMTRMSMSLDSLSTIGDDLGEGKASTSPTNIESIRNARTALFRSIKSSEVIPNKTDFFEEFSHDVIESSIDTVKAASANHSSLMKSSFLVDPVTLRETLVMLSDCLLRISSSRFGDTNATLSQTLDSLKSSVPESRIDNHVSRLSQYTREAQWRLELISGFGANHEELSTNAPTTLVGQYENHVIGKMLGSSETLVYLTLKKGDLVQAKKVIKMFNLTDHKCNKEVDFIEQLSVISEKLLKLSKPDKKERTHSTLDFVKSAASAGKISSEVNQTAEIALQHSFVVDHDSPLVSMATCLDLIFMSPVPYQICKTLVDLASLKTELCMDQSSSKLCSEISGKLKDMKALLQFATSRTLKIFQLCGQKTPADFVGLSMLVKSKLSAETIEFEESKLLQGLDAFNGLSDRIGVLCNKYTDLVDEVNEKAAVSLKERFSNLFTIFNSETSAQLNNNSTAFDYLKSLFKYVSSLSSLQLFYQNRDDLECKQGKPDNIRLLSTMKAANPFLVFNGSISSTFGKLLFEWGMPPKRLESFAKQSDINLVKVIAENCGISVSSTVADVGLQQKLLLKEQVVMNKIDGDIYEGVEPGKCPNSVVEELLNSVLDMISENGKYMPSQLTASEVCQVLKISTKDLEKVDLRELKTTAEKKSFFINLFNLMFLHGLMLIVADKFDASFDFNNADFSLLLQSSFGRLVIHDLLVYRVGDIGFLSAFELYQYVFLCGSKTEFFGIMEDPLWHSWFPSLHKYANDFHDYRCLFMLSHGSLDSPLVQVVYPNKLEMMLKSAAMEYLDDHVGVDNENKEIFIAEFIVLLKRYFLQSHQSSTQEELSKEKEELYPLLTALCQYASPNLKKKLTHAVKEKFMISIEKHDWNLRHALYKQTFSLSRKEITSSPQFSQISEPISRYLSETSPLVGIFVNLCLTRNNLVKNATTIFENNILHSFSDEDNSLNVFTSLQKGLETFTKQTTYYNVLKNFVFESSSIVINFLENVSTFESLLDPHTLKLCYTSIGSLLTHNFLSTLSPKDWSEIVPTLINCCFYSHTCHIIPLSNLELIVSLPPTLFDLICSHGIFEIKSALEMLKKETQQYEVSASISKFQHKLKNLLLLIKDPKKKSYLLLRSVHLLQAKHAVDLLKVCLELLVDVTIKQKLEDRLHEILWFENVFMTSKMCGKCDAFSDWQDVELRCSVDPEYVVSFLISVHSYNLLDTWCEDFDMSQELLQLAVKSKLVNVLKEHSSDYLTVQSILEKIKSREMLHSICSELLKERSCYNHKYLFVIQYMTNCLGDLLPAIEKRDILLNKIGILSIELIPWEFKESYKQIQHSPLLILEQLLMNVKVTIAGKMIKLINDEVDADSSLSFLLAEADDLVARYASLSIDLTILRTSSTPVHTPLLTPTHTPTLSRKIFNRTLHSPGHETTSSPLDVLASVVEQVKSEEEYRDRNSSTLSHTKEKQEFIPPLNPVDKKDWVKDDQVSSCMRCHDLFNMFNRRHHCRHCGRVVCASCSRFYCFMHHYNRKERTCARCYQYNYQPVLSDQPMNTEGLPNETSASPQLSSRMSHMDTPSPLPRGIDEPEWIFNTDIHANMRVREEFSFDQAPSASLCLGIVDLYSNQRAAGGLLLKFGNNLSHYLQLRSKGDEVDVNMVAGMIEFILNHAKIKFLKAHDFVGVELCDTHLSRVEILKILIEANWHNIPTMQELTQPECLRRMRDQLIENERFSLAMEVSSKCALDATPVNFIMGLSRLKCGDLEKAREYFARCLTVNRSDASKAFGPVNHYLERMIEVIENSPMIALNQISSDDLSLSPVTYMLEHYKNTAGECSLDKRRYDEIMFYLKTYGSRGQVIAFFVRNRLLKKAVFYIKENKCSHDLFISKILLPSFQDGYFDTLCEEIIPTDPALKFWGAYFTEGCRYFSKHVSYNCLYELQLFIKDYFRAALTCVRFYLGTTSGPPRSYTDLYGRLSYLHLANKHLDNLVKERGTRSSFVSHVGSSFLGDDKNINNQEISTSELKRYLSTVNLQIDVTKFLCIGKSADDAQTDEKIPTLFGNGKERAELAIKLLMWSGGDSLALTSRIIQEFKLPSSAIFGRALKKIAQSRKFPQVLSILQNIEQNGMIITKEKDEILLQVVKVITQSGQVKEANQFIKLIKNDIVKINTLIMCGRLKDAYLEAVKKERVVEIQRILDESRRSSSQKGMVDICERWLRNHQENQLRTEKALAKS